LVRIGDALGVYKILHAKGPMTGEQLSAESGVSERYLREWLPQQAASNDLFYDRTTRKFELPPEQTMVFAIEDSPVFMIGAFDAMAALVGNEEKVQPAFRSGDGVALGRSSFLSILCDRTIFPPWLRHLDNGVRTDLAVARSRRGAWNAGRGEEASRGHWCGWVR
jgi:hypothetical protein